MGIIGNVIDGGMLGSLSDFSNGAHASPTLRK